MGLFDKWRRKEQPKTTAVVRGREQMGPAKPLPVIEHPKEIKDMAPEMQQEIVNLVAEYERLVVQREELQQARGNLTTKLDAGEVTAIEFRKQLMDKIQEAARVSEQLKSVTSKLTALGYRGVLH